jgi:hypothetical protein
LRNKARQLFDGSQVVKAAGVEYLYQDTNESDEDYQIRLKRAVYENWPEWAVRTRQALLWRKSPVREGIEEGDVENVASGLHWVFVNQTTIPLGAITVAQQANAGVRPYFVSLPANCVYEWEIADDLALNWVVVAAKRTEPRETWELDRKEIQQRVVLTRTEWFVFESGEDGGFSLTAQGVHGLGTVPVVPFYGIKVTDFAGVPVTKDILDATLALYNKWSDRDWAERLANNPKLVSIGPEAPTVFKANANLGFHVGAIPGVTTEIFYLEPKATGIEATRQTEQDLRKSIYETTLHQARRDTAQVESSDTLKQQREVLNSSLAAASESYSQSERQCWDIFYAWKGSPNKDIQIHYNDDFEDKAVEEALLKTFISMVSLGMMRLETLYRIMEQGEILPSMVDVEEELKAIAKEESESAAGMLDRIRNNV